MYSDSCPAIQPHNMWPYLTQNDVANKIFCYFKKIVLFSCLDNTPFSGFENSEAKQLPYPGSLYVGNCFHLAILKDNNNKNFYQFNVWHVNSFLVNGINIERTSQVNEVNLLFVITGEMLRRESIMERPWIR